MNESYAFVRVNGNSSKANERTRRGARYRDGGECRNVVEETRKNHQPQSFSRTNAWVELAVCSTVNVAELSWSLTPEKSSNE